MLCCPRMSLEHMTEKMASVSGPFIKWSLRKTVKRETRLPELSIPVCFRACPFRHELNLAQHANLDSFARVVQFTYFKCTFLGNIISNNLFYTL